MFKTKPPPEECKPELRVFCVDQKQAKNKNLYIIFFGSDVTICMYLPPPMSLFAPNFEYSPRPYPAEVNF